MPLKGKIEIFNHRSVSGWIACYGTLTEPLLVEIVIDGEVIGQAETSGFREDVAQMNFGDGHCSFSIVFPEALTADQYNRAKLRISGSDLCIELPRPIPEPDSHGQDAGLGPCSPVFIVGSPRSGTSILVQSLASAGYNGFSEGNILGLSKLIQDCIDSYFIANDHSEASTLIGNISREELQDRFFETMKGQLEMLNPVKPWFDKTGNPETIWILKRIMKAWPTSRIIFAKRRGIENIMSRMQKFPERDFQYHCEDWARNMKAWRDVRDSLDPERILEVDQYDIAQDPVAVSENIGALLNLDQDQIHNVRHTFGTDRPQQSSEGSFRKRMRFADTGWSEEERSLFVQECGVEMQAFGYEMD